MPVTAITKDPDNLTMTVVADFDAPVRRVWDAYLDPRQLSRFWGPPEYPATFTQHDGYAGGQSHYFMTGPDGSTHGGYWDWIDVKPPQDADSVASFEVRDGFSNPDGTPNTDLPTGRMVLQFEPTNAGSRVLITSYFNSADELAQLLDMGQEEGMRAAMGQIDDVLADLTSFTHGIDTKTDILSATQVRVSRVIRGSVEQVWQAHHDAALLQRWLLGPDGWIMPVCEVATEVGDSYRYEWTRADGSDRFGFSGELLASDPPHRSVTTESFFGADGVHPGEPTTNEMTLTPQESGTLLSLVITYPSAEIRDLVLSTGMTDGMETSYARLESILV